MKNLKFLIIAVALLISSTAFAASNLWEFYNGDLPSISERAEIYDLDDQYRGTAEQNIYLLGQLQGESVLKLGASTQTSTVLALFETSLASKITDIATSLTLTSAIDKDGTTLASSTYGMIIDEGTATEELILADCTGTTCTNLTRGLSVRTGTTTVSALRHEHRRGAEIKITDAPALIFATNVFRGIQNIENKLKYDSNLTFTNDAELISKKYVDDTAFSGAGVIDASATARGVVELATGLETASSTATGGSGTLAIPASLATSTYNSATAGLKVVATQNNGKIDDNFISTSTLSIGNGSNMTLTGTTTMATSTATGSSNIASTSIKVITSTGTWTKLSNLRYVIVELVGGGGGGGGSSGADTLGGGGGGGGYSKKIIQASALGATETVTIGAGGAGGVGAGNGATGGTTSFGSHLSATGGTGGAHSTGYGAGNGGAGSSGDLNIDGMPGGMGLLSSAVMNSGTGGNSILGFGAKGLYATQGGGQGTNGTGGQLYGGGGSGAVQDGTGTQNGGAGAAGVVIVTEIYF